MSDLSDVIKLTEICACRNLTNFKFLACRFWRDCQVYFKRFEINFIRLPRRAILQIQN